MKSKLFHCHVSRCIYQQHCFSCHRVGSFYGKERESICGVGKLIGRGNFEKLAKVEIEE